MKRFKTATLLLTMLLCVTHLASAQERPPAANPQELLGRGAKKLQRRLQAQKAKPVVKKKTPRRDRTPQPGPRPGGGPASPKADTSPQPGDPQPTGSPSDPSAGAMTLPGEKEFNECIKIPARRRIKVTLKQNSDLMDLVSWISSMTCKKFIVADTLRAQKITLISPTAITAAEAYRAFLSSLEVMGLTVAPAGKYLKIVQGNWAIQSPIPTYTDKGPRVPNTDQVVTKLVRVQNVDVNELLLVLNKMKSRNGDITSYKPSNMLIITDNAYNVRRMAEMVQALDVETIGEKIWVIRLKKADVEEIHKILTQIFSPQGRGPQIMARPAIRPGMPPGAEDVADLSASKIIADPVSNSLIIVASASAFAKIASLIKKLEVDGEEGDQRIHVYPLENANAEDMANSLGGLTSGAGTPRRRMGASRRGRTSSRTPGTTASLFEGEVKVSADKPTNSLIIVASNKDYLSLRKVIKELDIPRRQVFVEATIMEISLDKGRKLGFAYHGGGKAGEGDSESIIFGGVEPDPQKMNSFLLNPLTMMGLAVGARMKPIQGSTELTGLDTNIPAFGVLFQAIQNNSNVNVLSSPHLLTTDNEEAEITVGQNIPFQGAFAGSGLSGLSGLSGGTSGQSGSNPLAGVSSFLPMVSVQRQDVALKLKITPHVNDSDMVRLELEQEVSDIVSKNFEGMGPATSKRSAKTVVVVQDQQTVVIGGLMGNRNTNTEAKVPLLGDIPILGHLFKYTEKSMQKTNLLIVLTPYVIRDQSDLRRIFKKKVEERREFIERYTTFTPEDLERDIDFRHKRGLLAEINKVGAQAEMEVKLLDEARRETNDVSEPVDMPKELKPSDRSSAPSRLHDFSGRGEVPGGGGIESRPPMPPGP